jgi:hypothetical protein
MVGGLAATIAIDVLTMLVLPLIGAPADGGFILIGDTAAAFFAAMGLQIAGGVPLGLFFHYLIGILLGGLFGAAVSRLAALRTASRLKMAGLGVLYTELISIPIVILPPLILEMSRADILQWLGFCVIMHGIFGLVLGLVVSYGLRAPARARPPSVSSAR